MHVNTQLLPASSSSMYDDIQLDINVVDVFHDILQTHTDMSTPVAAMKTLIELIQHTKATTAQEFTRILEKAIHILKTSTRHPISVMAGCDLFLRYCALTRHDFDDFVSWKNYLVSLGTSLLEKAASQKHKIVQLALDFIRDGDTLLVHSYSRVVMQLLVSAARQHKRFRVFVTESRPSNSGYRVQEGLRDEGIPVTVILDTAVGMIMEQVDMVLCGAEGVVENGGLINQVGTYQMAVVAKAARKPFYAAAESFKFVRWFPLNQYDLPMATVEGLVKSVEAKKETLPGQGKDAALATAVDYTPPDYITLLLTDIGILTPSGVSEELIKLHL